MDTQVEDKGTQAAVSSETPTPGAASLEAVMKGGALVAVVALGGVAVGLAIWALRRWMDEREYQSVAQMIGSMSQQHCAEPAAFERANYMKILDSFQPIN